MSGFVEVTHLTSPVWKYFKRNTATSQALCNICGSILKSSGFSTKSLLSHVKNVHKIKIVSETDVDQSTSTASKRPKMSLMTDHFAKKQELTLDYRVSRMCASNLFSFNAIATSADIRDGFL